MLYWPPDHSSHTDHSDFLKYIDHLDTLDHLDHLEHLDHLDHLDLFHVLAGTLDESIKHTQFYNKNGQQKFLNSKFKPHRLHSLVSHFFPAAFPKKLQYCLPWPWKCDITNHLIWIIYLKICLTGIWWFVWRLIWTICLTGAWYESSASVLHTTDTRYECTRALSPPFLFYMI